MSLLADEVQSRCFSVCQQAKSNELHTDTSSQENLEDDEMQIISVRRAEADAPLLALDSLVLRRRARGVAHIRLPNVEELPKYDAWVPVIHNFYVTEPGVDPYIPYFGDGKRNVHVANQCYRQMLVDAKFRSARSPFDELSDGEIHQDGFVSPPRTEDDWYIFNALEQVRKRAAIRVTIASIAERHGQNDEVWKSLSFALNIRDVRRLRYIYNLADRRASECKKQNDSFAKTRTYSKQVRRAATIPQPESDVEILQRDGCAQGALKHFCFPCHKFGCHFHEGENVAPILPIPDHSTDERMRKLKYQQGEIPPCSQSCFLLAAWSQVPASPEEMESWTPEQMLLLREGATMYQFDPCNLSVLTGRTCREVYDKMILPLERRELVRIMEQCKMPRPVKNFSTLGGAASLSGDGFLNRGQRGRITERVKKGKKPVRAIKTAPNAEDDEGEDEDLQKRYRPCNHLGVCTRKNSCDCALRGLNCEIYCGCNCGRYMEGSNGMIRDPPTDAELMREVAIECSRRFVGCRCKSGHCSTDACLCFASRRVCNPDVCETCECTELLTERGLVDRRCRNSAAVTSRHKHTYMGKSKVHGYGLFAGDYFNRGDLVGLYCGRIMHPDLIEETLRTYQAKRMTYAFSLQDTLTLDAGLMGSKAKFLNHCEDEGQNCLARMERLRGDGIIVLRASKPVAPGEELMFNYNIIGEGGNDWIKNSESYEASDSSENPESPLEPVATEDTEQSLLANMVSATLMEVTSTSKGGIKTELIPTGWKQKSHRDNYPVFNS